MERISRHAIRLDRLLAAAGFSRQVGLKWFRLGIIKGQNLGRGRGRGIWLTEAQALAAACVMSLRHAGISLAALMRAKRAKDDTGTSVELPVPDGRGGETTCLLDAGTMWKHAAVLVEAARNAARATPVVPAVSTREGRKPAAVKRRRPALARR